MGVYTHSNMTAFEDLRARAEAGDVRAQVALGNLCQGVALKWPPGLSHAYAGELVLRPLWEERSWERRLQTADYLCRTWRVVVSSQAFDDSGNVVDIQPPGPVGELMNPKDQWPQTTN